MPAFIGAGSAWKAMLSGSGGDGTAIGVGGVWKSIEGMWIGEGGAWKQFFNAFALNLTQKILDGSVLTGTGSGVSEAGITFNTDGTLDQISGWSGDGTTPVSGQWGTATITDIGDLYEVEAVKSSGSETLPTGWQTISTARSYGITSADNTSKTWIGTITVREIADTGNSITVNLNLTAQVASL